MSEQVWENGVLSDCERCTTIYDLARVPYISNNITNDRVKGWVGGMTSTRSPFQGSGTKSCLGDTQN